MQNKCNLEKIGEGKENAHFVQWDRSKEVTWEAGKGPGVPPLHRESPGFLRDWSHLTKEFALESVAFPFSSLWHPSSVILSVKLKPSELFIEWEQFYHRVWCLIWRDVKARRQMAKQAVPLDDLDGAPEPSDSFWILQIQKCVLVNESWMDPTLGEKG